MKVSKTIVASLSVVGLVSLMATPVQAGQKCYALVLGAGDESAAFQSGVLQSLLESLSPEESQYYSVFGVQGSSVNAILMANAAKGQEKSAVSQMQKFWLDAGASKLYQDWWVGPWAALFSAGGIYDPSPFKNFLQKEMASLDVTAASPLQRELTIGIVDVLKGNYQTLNEGQIGKSSQSIIDTIFTSFAYPGFFPPAAAFGSEWFDGASVNTLDVLGAINSCREMPGVESDEDIVVDVIMTQSSSLDLIKANDYTSMGMLFRYLQISHFYGTMNGLERAKFAHPNVTYRHVIAPSATLPSTWFPLSSNATEIQFMIEQGVRDGADAIKKGLTSIDDHLAYFKSSQAPLKAGASPKTKLSFQEFVAAKIDKKSKDDLPSFLKPMQE